MTRDIDVVYLTSGGRSPVLHLRPDCQGTASAKDVRAVDPSGYPHRRLCKWCDPDVDVLTTTAGSTAYETTCRVCGETLEDGTCPWCAKLAEEGIA